MRHLASACLLIASAGAASAQTPPEPMATSRALAPSVFISFGPAALIEGGEFIEGRGTSLGIGVILPLWEKLALQIEGSEVLGTSVRAVSTTRRTCRGGVCGPVEPYTFHDGTSTVRQVTATAIYFFRSRGIQPFVGIGIGAVHQKGVIRCTPSCPSRDSEEQAFSKTTLTMPLTGGLRIPVGSRFAILPAIHLADASFDLADTYPVPRTLFRASVALSYEW